MPTLGGRVKNLENWLLVELVHRLFDSNEVQALRTNGFVDQVVMKPTGARAKLLGRKRKSKTLSPDLSVRTIRAGIVDVEIRTGLNPLEVMDDLTVVEFYREKGRPKPEFAWVVLIPEVDAGSSVLKGVRRVQQNAQSRHFHLNVSEVRPCLLYAIAAPDGTGRKRVSA